MEIDIRDQLDASTLDTVIERLTALRNQYGGNAIFDVSAETETYPYGTESYATVTLIVKGTESV